MKLIVARDVGLTIAAACERGYPEECCGALVGAVAAAGERVVARALPIGNIRRTERRTRYLIGPEEYRAADAAARAAGLEVVGFYHSHPDHPAVPSAFDREHAWPWYAYVIVPVARGRAGRARCWQLADDRSRFTEIEIAAGATEPSHAQEATR